MLESQRRPEGAIGGTIMLNPKCDTSILVGNFHREETSFDFSGAWCIQICEGDSSLLGTLP